MNPYQIVKRPLLTERSTMLKETANQYVFEVEKAANKHQIRDAIETAFKVEVVGVSTMIVPGKRKSMGRFSGKKSSWKKAVVRLKEGQTIDLIEGV